MRLLAYECSDPFLQKKKKHVLVHTICLPSCEEASLGVALCWNAFLLSPMVIGISGLNTILSIYLFWLSAKVIDNKSVTVFQREYSREPHLIIF